MNDLIGAFYCIGVMDGRTYQLGECTTKLTEFGEQLNALIAENTELEAEVRRLEEEIYDYRLEGGVYDYRLENDRLRAKIDRLSGEVRYPREEYPR